ncbi:MAG: hypothetical protein ACLFTP_10920 [Rhodosalinus sp.]|uniref:hypothetical protein n=1 Tax=Rhodosalinus sp. TaxID=2047741 RepID=UPI003979A204
MTERDSFLEEVAEEVRRDRMFALMRRYGWIAVLAVLLIVGGAAWNEWRKAQAVARAQATGDAILEALSPGDPQARAEALSALDPRDPGARAAVDMLRADALAEAGDEAAAAELLDGVGGSDLAPIYGQIAAFKALLQRADTLSPEERRQGFSQLASAGGPLRLLAEEQIALTEIETGATEAALERLGTIRADDEATPGLRRRAAQLIVALGGEPQLQTGG